MLSRGRASESTESAGSAIAPVSANSESASRLSSESCSAMFISMSESSSRRAAESTGITFPLRAARACRALSFAAAFSLRAARRASSRSFCDSSLAVAFSLRLTAIESSCAFLILAAAAFFSALALRAASLSRALRWATVSVSAALSSESGRLPGAESESAMCSESAPDEPCAGESGPEAAASESVPPSNESESAALPGRSPGTIRPPSGPAVAADPSGCCPSESGRCRESAPIRASESAAAFSAARAQGILIDRKEEHRVGTHEERIALRKVVAHHRGAPREEYIARLLPILAVIAEGEHLVAPYRRSGCPATAPRGLWLGNSRCCRSTSPVSRSAHNRCA